MGWFGGYGGGVAGMMMMHGQKLMLKKLVSCVLSGTTQRVWYSLAGKMPSQRRTNE